MHSQGLQRRRRTCNADARFAARVCQDLQHRHKNSNTDAGLAADLRRKAKVCNGQDLQRKATSCGAGLQLRAIFCNAEQQFATQSQDNTEPRLADSQRQDLQRRATICGAGLGLATQSNDLRRKARTCNAELGLATQTQKYRRRAKTCGAELGLANAGLICHSVLLWACQVFFGHILWRPYSANAASQRGVRARCGKQNAMSSCF